MATAATSSVSTSSRRKGGKRPPPTEITNGPTATAEAVTPKKPKVADGVTPVKNKIKKEPEVLAFDWTSEELAKLIANLTECLPRTDNVKYTTLIDKLDWEKVRFGQYSASQCKDKWMQVMTRLRRFRTLTDMVTDAKEWLKHPWSSYSSSKKQKHPEMPKKPLTPYFRYFLEKREKYSREHPEMSMTDLAKLLSKKFQQLPEKKKQKYKESYEKENEVYKQELEKFKKEHPDQFPNPEVRHTAISHEGPDKPQTAFQLFLADRLKRSEYSEIDRKEAAEKVRKQWNSLSDGKRIKWIRKAVQEDQKYTGELQKYCQDHPEFKPDSKKNILSKAEKELKDRYDGKPERPPNSGYSLFSRIMLRELKEVPSKEKMAEISKRWKQLNETERESYNKQAQKANAKYKEKYAAYLNGLSEEERQRIENESRNSNKKKIPNDVVTSGNQDDGTNGEGLDDSRPKKPVSALFYFQQEKFSVFRQKYPNMSKQELMRLLAREYNELTEKKKEKYKAMAEEAKKIEEGPNALKGKEPVTESGSGSRKQLFRGEPRKPAQSGYGLFSTEMLSVLTDVDPKQRMAEIAKRWKAMPIAEKEKYKKRVAELMKKYNKDFQKFLSNLTPSELQEYERHKEKSKNKSKGAAGKSNPAQAQNKQSQPKKAKEESESESSDDDDDEDSSDDDDDDDDDDDEEEGSGKSGNEDDSGSDSDDSGSGSGSDESGSDDDDDDDSDEEGKGDGDNDSSSGDSDSDSDSGSGSGSDDSSESGSESEEEEEEEEEE